MKPVLYIVIPCYNESEVIELTAHEVTDKLQSFISASLVSDKSRILFVNDCSTDDTWEKISALHAVNPLITAVSLAHNAGEQNAYLAGMSEAVRLADAVITTDADLQDDINAMDEMLAEFLAGKAVVYAVRERRDEDSAFKRVTAAAFYRVMKMLGSEQIPEHSQYRLMSKRVVEAVLSCRETEIFLPALVPSLGFESAVVYHKRSARAAGESKYSPVKLVRLSLLAIFSSTVGTVRFIGAFALISLLCALSGAIALLCRLPAAPLWLFVFTGMWLAGALLLFVLRLIASYAAKISREIKNRPRYIIEERL